MEKLPSTLVIHKRADGIDTRLASLEEQMVMNPLEKYLNIHRFGTFKKSDHYDFAFDRIEDLWQEEIDDDDDDWVVNEEQVEADNSDAEDLPEQETELKTKELQHSSEITDSQDHPDDVIPETMPIQVRKKRRR